MLVPTNAPHWPSAKKTSPVPALAATSGRSRQSVWHAYTSLPHSQSAGCQLGRWAYCEIPPPPAPSSPASVAHAGPTAPSQSFHPTDAPPVVKVVPPTAVTEGSDAG